MMFAQYMKTKEFISPDEPIYYLLARDGLFIVKKNQFFSSSTKVEGLPWLETHGESFSLGFPQLPYKLMLQAISFFKEVFRRHGSEAILLLYYSPEEKRYQLIAPKQEVDPLFCRYEEGPTPEGWFRLGSIHCHGSLAASHSDIDEADERYEDGLHITVGSITGIPTTECDLVVGDRRFSLNPSEVIEPFEAVPVPEEWFEKITGWTRGT